MITFKKLLRVLGELEARGHKGGYVYSDSGGELKLCFSGQPDLSTHLWLIKKKGFVVLPGGDYVYRPR